MHSLLDGQKAREMETAGDGACALHAAFGDGISRSGQATCEGARSILARVLGDELDDVNAQVRPRAGAFWRRLLQCYGLNLHCHFSDKTAQCRIEKRVYFSNYYRGVIS